MSDTDKQLSDALTAKAVAERGATEALLNRVASLITSMQVQVLEVQERLEAITVQIAALAEQVDRLQSDLSAHQQREEAGVEALRDEVLDLRTERRAAGSELAQRIAELEARLTGPDAERAA